MSELYDDDLFVVQRNGENFRVQNQNRSELEDDDKFIVSRDGVLYYVNAEDVGGGERIPEISNVVLTQDQINDNRFTSNSFTTTVAGVDVDQLDMQATITGALAIEGTTDAIERNNYEGLTGVILDLKSDFNLDNGLFEVGDHVVTNESYTPQTAKIISAVNRAYSQGISDNYYKTTDPFSAGDFDYDNYLKGYSFHPNVTGSWTAPAGGVGTTSVRINTYFYENSSVTIYGNGLSFTFAPQMSVNGVNESFDNGAITTTIFTEGSSVDNTYITVNPKYLPLTKIEVTTTQASRASYINQIYVDGEKLIDTGYELELESDKDIRLFQTGDIVQKLPGIIRVGYNGGLPAQTNDTVIAAAFDGDLSTFYSYHSGGSGNHLTGQFTFYFPKRIENITSLKIASAWGSSSPIQFPIDINGVRKNPTNHWGGGPVPLLNFPGITYLDSITFYAGYGAAICAGIEVNGELLDNKVNVVFNSADYENNKINVSGGNWITPQSIVWSSFSNNNTYGDPYDIDKLFDGVILRGNACIGPAEEDGWMVWEYPQGIPFSTLKFCAGKYGVPPNSQLKVNGVNINNVDQITAQWSWMGWYTPTFESDIGNTLYKIELYGWSSPSFPATGIALGGIEIDGNLLIDAFGEDVVTGPVKRGEGVINFINGADIVIEPFVDNCFAPGQYILHKTPKVLDITPKSDSIHSYDADTKTITLTGDKDLLDFSEGDEVTMCDADGNAVTVTPVTSTIAALSGGNEAKTLVFTDDTDLRYFSPGDEVQDNRIWNQDENWTSKCYNFRLLPGNTPPISYGFNASSSDGNLSQDDCGIRNLDFTNVTSCVIRGNSGSSDTRTLSVQLNNDSSTKVDVASQGNSYIFDMTSVIPSDKKIDSIQFLKNGNPYTGFCTIHINGILLVDPNIGGNPGPTELNKVVDVDVAAKTMIVDGGKWLASNTQGDPDGETVVTGPEKSGTGIVSASDPTTNRLTLSESNDQWLYGYYVKGPTKPAVSMTAYLGFDAYGTVTNIQSAPLNSLMLNKVVPKLTFPETFSTGNAPDTEIPYPSYLQTTVQGLAQDSVNNTDKISSNILFPASNTVLALKTPKTYTTEQFGEFCRWACSFEYRDAIKTIQDTEETLAELRVKAENQALKFINDQEESN